MSADPEIVKALRNNRIVLEHSGDYWTEDDDYKLKSLFNDGIGITEMAVKLQRSEDAVYLRIQKLDLYDRAHYPKRKKPRPKCLGCLCDKCPHYHAPCPIRDHCMEFKEDE